MYDDSVSQFGMFVECVTSIVPIITKLTILELFIYQKPLELTFFSKIGDYFTPVWPNPPSPRSVSFNASTSLKITFSNLEIMS